MKNKIIRTALTLFFVSLFIIAPHAQQTTSVAVKQSPEDRVALYQALLDLTNPWTVMCIAAHPDDEDGTTLIVMRRKYGAHTVSLFSTFGEGGQNAIGPELYEELGAIRARETMAAAEIQGSEPHFLGLKDFGFSKSADEAFRVWGHDEALRRMVLQIRKLRPDVIITNHNTTNGHGHHQATGRLELEAFDAAADPARFPEQLKDGVTTWQVQRLFLRLGFGNQLPGQNGGTVTIDPNERDPIRDTVFAEEALRALQKHATQGPWPKTFADMLRFRNSQDGKVPLTRYVLVREAKGAEALPKDSHNFLDGLRLPEEIAKRLQPPTVDGHPLTEYASQPDRVFDAISAALKSEGFKPGQFLEGPAGESHLHLISGRTDTVLALASGITTRILPADPNVVPGTHAAFMLKVTNAGDRPARLANIVFHGFSTNGNATTPPKLEPGSTIDIKISDQVPTNAEITVPHSMHLYDDLFAGRRLWAGLAVEVAGTRFLVPETLRTDVVPAVEITNNSLSPIVSTPGATKSTITAPVDCVFRDFDYNLRVTNNQDVTLSGEIVTGPRFGRKAESWKLNIAAHDKADLVLSVPGCSQITQPVKVDQQKPVKAGQRKPEPVTFTVVAKGTTKPLARLDVPVIWADARVAPNLRVGYIRGFDYSLPNALTALGVESKELKVDEVKTADLQKYSAVIVDNRVYESQPELIAVNQRLLDYANAGGTLIVFYHKSNEWNPDERRKRPQLAPYKLILGDERVTDETAPITFIEPQHPLLNLPNKMGQEDFANWIQERGLYYPKDWDPQYHALLQSNDPGGAPLKGGLLVADYGRGHYIYTSMVWYRELRAGVPGAYRMLANMISYGQAEGKRKK
jgi:LmbE family N-acetylglucosaminyl deacetylase